MLTARSEYRLFLRADNAVFAVGADGARDRCADREQSLRVRQHLDEKAEAVALLSEAVTGQALRFRDTARKPLAEWARRDDLLKAVRDRLPGGMAVDEAIDDAVYAPYLARLHGELAVRERDRRLAIRSASISARTPGLSSEMRERLVEDRAIRS
jgi:tRNA uridine 5-carboxymethylaminomethyl modification enzyme